jgi:hypothetical protein
MVVCLAENADSRSSTMVERVGMISALREHPLARNRSIVRVWLGPGIGSEERPFGGAEVMEKRGFPDAEFSGEFAGRGLSGPLVIAVTSSEIECVTLSGRQYVLPLTDGLGPIGPLRAGRGRDPFERDVCLMFVADRIESLAKGRPVGMDQ